MPPATVLPERLNANGVVVLPYVGATIAVPAVGVPEHAVAPVPVTGSLAGEANPPPVIVMFAL